MQFSTEDSDLAALSWSRDKHGYPTRGKRSVRASRLVGERVAGRPLTRHDEVRILNGDKLDLRRHNLVIVPRGSTGNKAAPPPPPNCVGRRRPMKSRPAKSNTGISNICAVYNGYQVQLQYCGMKWRIRCETLDDAITELAGLCDCLRIKHAGIPEQYRSDL